MELVFFYVVKSESGFIENTGFNFSPNYKFSVDYNNEDDVYILKQEECITKLPRDFFDEDGCITNVTAIVGENGSGKTTLLNMLLNHTLGEKDIVQMNSCDEKFVYIFLKNTDLVCYYNLTNMYSETNAKMVFSNSISEGSTGFNKKIFLTNNMFSKYGNIVSVNRNYDGNMFFTGNVLEFYKDCFYKNKHNKKNYVYYDPNQAEYHDLIQKKNNNKHQNILDILYLKHMDISGINSIFFKSITKNIKIEIDDFEKYVPEICFSDHVDDSYYAFDFALDYVKKKILDEDFFYSTLNVDFSARLYVNFLFEFYLCNALNERFRKWNYYDCEKVKIKSKDNLISFIEYILMEFSDKSNYHIFKCYLDEIKMYDEFFSNLDKGYLNANQLYFLFDFNSVCFEKFVKLLNNSIVKIKNSIVLKYISITSLNLASGERALLNLFSWVYLSLIVFSSNNLNDKIINLDTKDHTLILIDEVDLYCHPLWQQKLLKNLIEEFKSLFKGMKVQIIFSTHSPIVLSDLPRSNIIFLERKNDKCSIYEDNLSNETFGANIYKLFDDAFFLEKKGQIGEFAREKIQEIIDRIKPIIIDDEENENIKKKVIYPELSLNEIDVLEQQISLIGEPIIRDKLFDMLYKNYPELAIKKKIQRYEAELKKLHNLKNGGNL